MVLSYPHALIQFINIADKHILPRVVDTPGQLLYAASPYSMYKWSADSQNVVLMTGAYFTPNGMGVRQYGKLYALDFQTGTWRQLTQDHWIKQYTTSPISARDIITQDGS